MAYDYTTVPVRITRNGESFVVPVCDVKIGDGVWMGATQCIVDDLVEDPEEGVCYLGVRSDLYPAQCFAGQL